MSHMLSVSPGNYGVPSDERDEYGLHRHFESDRVQVAALIVADYSFDHSHHAAAKSLSQVCALTAQRDEESIKWRLSCLTIIIFRVVCVQNLDRLSATCSVFSKRNEPLHLLLIYRVSL